MDAEKNVCLMGMKLSLDEHQEASIDGAMADMNKELSASRVNFAA